MLLSALLKVFLLALFWRASCSQLLRKDLYVTTEQDNTCPTGPHTCLTIADYLHGNQHLFASNTTLHFLPGLHIVNGSGTDSSTVVIANLTDFSLEGWGVPTGEPPVVTIQCSHPVNFHFTNITRLSIQNINFIHCSRNDPTFNFARYFFYCAYSNNISGSLELENLHDLVLHNVHITESSGFGLVGLNLLGTTTVRYCHFYNNSGNASANTPGGNALLCLVKGKQNKVEVSNSEFDSGSNPTRGGGLDIVTTNTSICIFNCSFSRNMGSKGADIYFFSTYSYIRNRAIIEVGNSSFYSSVSATDGGSCYLDNVNVHFYHSIFSENSAGMNGGAIYISGPIYKEKLFDYRFTNCSFTKNRAEQGGAIYSESPSAKLSVSKSKFYSNVANEKGGHIMSVGNRLWLSNCWFEKGSTKGSGGGVYHSLTLTCANLVVINSTFIHNTACTGGGLYIAPKPHSNDIYLNDNVNVDIYDTQFIGNIVENDSSAINVKGYGRSTLIPDYQVCDLILTVANGLFTSNVVYPLHHKASTFSVNNIESFHLISSQILSNNGSAIHACESEISLAGDVVIADNTAYVGGALYLDCFESLFTSIDYGRKHRPSVVRLETNSSLLIRNNTALHYGGAIALNEQCGPQTSDQSTPRETCTMPCFFNIPEHNSSTVESLPVVQMEGNSALIAGKVFYGGPLETCTYSQNPQANAIQMFRSIFTNNQTLSTIDVVSDPIRVCFCIQEVTEGPYCLIHLNITIYRGENFIVPSIAVAPLADAPSSGFVMAELKSDGGQLGWLQKVQELNTPCDNLTYTVTTSEEYAELHLSLIKYPQSQISLIHILFLDCPFGFELTEEPSKCDCAKHLTSAVPQITCDINSYSVHLPDSAWVGNFLGGIVAHPNCPHDYCNAGSHLVSVDSQDGQCSHKHSGVLCGSCQTGLSLALGSSRCLQCSNIYLLLLLPFAVTGILLVIMLQKCNLTVSKGTINGLIFYANIIQVNKAYFSPQNNRLLLTKFLAVFIAWINLDLGIETCFASGLNAIARVWLQFVFPAYVWIIVGVMIYTSRYSVTASKLTGSNAVPVLATLFLLSYTKLLRTVIAAVSPIAITDQNTTSHLLWATDSNVAFLRGAHIPLFLTAVVMTAVYIVPLTTVVTLAPYLQARSQHTLLRWVVRIKPLLDAYTGPYTDKHRYWTGFMLLTRILLFIAFAANSTGDPKLNLLFISIVVAGVLVLQRYAGKLYKNSINRALEVFYLLNLLLLSIITLFLKGLRDDHSVPLAQEITVCTMVGASFLLFIFTLCWHMCNYTFIHGQVKQKLARVFLKFTQQPQLHSAEVIVQIQERQTQPTVSNINMSELREPLLTDD